MLSSRTEGRVSPRTFSNLIKEDYTFSHQRLGCTCNNACYILHTNGGQPAMSFCNLVPKKVTLNTNRSHLIGVRLLLSNHHTSQLLPQISPVKRDRHISIWVFHHVRDQTAGLASSSIPFAFLTQLHLSSLTTATTHFSSFTPSFLLILTKSLSLVT